MLEFVSLCLIAPAAAAAAAAANESNIHCLFFLPRCPLLHFAGSEKREDGSPDGRTDGRTTKWTLDNSIHLAASRSRSGSCLIISQHSAAAAAALLETIAMIMSECRNERTNGDPFLR